MVYKQNVIPILFDMIEMDPFSSHFYTEKKWGKTSRGGDGRLLLNPSLYARNTWNALPVFIVQNLTI
jgi:hypothetical protein